MKSQPHIHQVRDCYADSALVSSSGKKDHGSYYLSSLNEYMLTFCGEGKKKHHVPADPTEVRMMAGQGVRSLVMDL